jgi:hypothetical protein
VKSKNAPTSAFVRRVCWSLLLTKCCLGPLPFAPPIQSNNQATMAEQMPNGDAPINTDVEMKEEAAAEVQRSNIYFQRSD